VRQPHRPRFTLPLLCSPVERRITPAMRQPSLSAFENRSKRYLNRLDGSEEVLTQPHVEAT
jgi:hypothetical protein